MSISKFLWKGWPCKAEQNRPFWYSCNASATTQNAIGKPGALIRDLLGRGLIIKHGCYFSSDANQRAEVVTAGNRSQRGDRSPPSDGLQARAQERDALPLSSDNLLSTCTTSIPLMGVTDCLLATPAQTTTALVKRRVKSTLIYVLLPSWEETDRLCQNSSNEKRSKTSDWLKSGRILKRKTVFGN